MKFPKVITIACEKGGVGKTTIATNLAVYLKAMLEDLPVTIFSFDNHFTIDRMFALEKKIPKKSVSDIFAGENISSLVEFGQYGVHYVPSARKLEPDGYEKDRLLSALSESSLDGVVIMDTRPVLDYFTKAALLASDIIIVPVKDLPSFNNLKGITDIFEEANLPLPEMKLLPSIVDGMVKFKKDTISMDKFLRSVSTERGYDLMKSSIPKSPKVESLTTNLTFEVYPIINHAKGTRAHKGFTEVTQEIISSLDEKKEPKSLLLYRTRHFDTPGPDNKRYRQFMDSVLPYCPICSEEISSRTLYIKPDMLYFESGTRTKGFIDTKCIISHLLEPLTKKAAQLQPIIKKLIKTLYKDSTLSINVTKEEGGEDLKRLTMTLYDLHGDAILRGSTEIKNAAGIMPILETIMEKTQIGPSPCLIKLGGQPMPDSIFLEKSYHNFQDLKIKMLLDTNNPPL